MKTRFSRRDFLKMSMLGLGSAYLAACGKVLTPTPPVNTGMPPSTPLPTGTPQPPRPTSVPYTTNEPYAYYDFADSFESLSDPAPYGITSSQNTVKVNSANPNTLYQTGQQSLEASGTIAGPSGSTLSIEFDVKKYLGSSSYDFSNKVIVIDVFIPADSPIDWINFEADRDANIAQVSGFKIFDPEYGSSLIECSQCYTSSLPKGQWVEAVLDIKDVFSGNPNDKLWDAWGPNGQLTNAEALEVVRNCDVFKIEGRREKDGNAGPASFILDDLRWLERDSIKTDTSVDSLRKYAVNTHLFIGTCVQHNFLFGILDAKYCQALAQEFNLLQPEPWYMSDLEPSEGVFDFSKDDAVLDFATGNHMEIMGYTGAEHTSPPSWVKNKSFSELGPVLTKYIDTVVGHYRGKVASWVIFNEVVNDHGDGFRNRQTPDTAYEMFAYSPWVDGNDTSLIKAAFKQGRISDPNAKLFLNDFIIEEIGRVKSEFFYTFVKALVAEGIPIDGVGFEMHITYPPLFPNTNWATPRVLDLPAYLKSVGANIKRYAALGLQVAFTEVDDSILIKDIDISTTSGQAELKRRLDNEGQIYGGLMQLALNNQNVSTFKTMDFSDKYSWVYQSDPNGNPGYGFPDILDKDYKPKPAYVELLKALKNGA
jgi:endo-1,4-beta-xylanase